MNASGRKSEWTLWVVAISCILHVIEEYSTGWFAWAAEKLGIVMPVAPFLFGNAILVVFAFLCARIGWRQPMLTLIVPGLTLVNGIFFHILPTIVQGRVSPGVYTATILYLPFSSWAFVGARKDGVPFLPMVVAFVIGATVMVSVVLAAKGIGR